MKKKEIEEYIKSKSITQDSYVAPTVQTHIDTKNAPAMAKIGGTANTTIQPVKVKSISDVPIAVGSTVYNTAQGLKNYDWSKAPSDLGQRAGYVGKQLGSGLFRAGTSIVDAPLQEVQNDLETGTKRDKNWYDKNALLTLGSLLINPDLILVAKQGSKLFDKEYQKKNTMDKILDNVNDIVESSQPQGLKEAVRTYGTFDKQVLGGKAPKNIEKLSNTINKPSEDFQKSLEKESLKYKDDPLNATNLIGGAAQSVGFMGPSILASAVTKDPSLSLATMGVAAKGASTREALDKGMDLNKAIKIGNAKALTEVGTEMLTGGVNIFGKGALDEITTKAINSYVKKPVLNFLAKQGIGVGGEILEEVVANTIDNTIDKFTTDPDRKIWDWNEFWDTVAQTTLSTLMLNGLTGGYGRNAYNSNLQQMQQQTANQEAVRDLGDTYKQSSIDRVRGLETTPTLNNINTPIQTQNTQTNANILETQNVPETVLNNEIRKSSEAFNLGKNKVENTQQINNEELSLADAMEKAETDLEQGNVNYVNELMNNLDDVQIEGLENIQDDSQGIETNLTTEKQGVLNDDYMKMKKKMNDSGENFSLSNFEKNDIMNKTNERLIQNNSDVELIPIENIIANYQEGGNRNNPKSMRLLANDILENGFENPIIISRENGKILTGNHRLFLANEMGLDSVPVQYVNSSNEINYNDNNWNQKVREGLKNNEKQERTTYQNDERMQNEQMDNQWSDRFTRNRRTNAENNQLYNPIQENDNRYATETIRGDDDNGNIRGKIENERTSDSSFSNENIPAMKEGEPYIKITGEEGELYWKDQGADDKVAKILSEVPKEKTNLKDTANEVAGSLYRNIVSKGGEIEKISRQIKKPNVNYAYDKMLRANAEAQQHIGDIKHKEGDGQRTFDYKLYKNFTDANGNKVSMSLNDIRNDAKNSGISEQTLNEYLAHKLNEYRYEEGKPVFGKNITSEMSTEICENIEKQNPEIKRIAENVWQFEQNQLKNLYDSGLISETRYNELSKNKHYVRIQRQMSTNRGTKITTDKNGKVQINQPIQAAKGGNQDIMPIMEGIAKYTTDLVKMERTNESMRELGKALGMGSTNENINAFVDEESFGINPDLVKDNGDGTYTMTYFDKGIPTVVPINKGIYDAYVRNKAVSLIEGSKAFKTITYAPKKISQVFRSLTTNNNPLFMATNFFKDIGDAPFNSKYTTQFAKTYLSTEALRQVAGNGVYNQLYNAAGGNSDSYFVDGNFTDKTTNKVKKGIEKLWSPVQKGNEIVESVPRVAEFIATIKANGYEVNANGELVAQKGVNPTKTSNEVLNEALYNAAEITTNFKRGGDVAKSLNRNGATFLNASIQGFDKQIRNFKDALTSGDKKQIVHLLTKALIFGIAPTMLNDAANDDDDEYKEMPDYQKDNYYLFKADNGKWIRIPKGRAMSVLGSAARRTKNFVTTGDISAYKGLWDFAKTQVAPNSIFENNILAPFSQVKNNKSWSGSKIIPDSIAKRPTEEQYNEKTDSFSKWLGQVFKDIPVPKEYENFKSPMAINYLIDQYTGAIGDVVLPMTAEKATSDQSPLIAPITSKFTVDSAYSNKSVSDFYDTKTEIEKKKNSVKATGMDTAKNSYMTSKNLQMSNLYKEQREIQSNSSLSKKEKYKQAREVQKEINNLAKETVEEVKNAKKEEYYIKIGNYYYKKVRQNGKDTYVRDTSKKIPTEQYALYDYFKEKYEKSKERD